MLWQLYQSGGVSSEHQVWEVYPPFIESMSVHGAQPFAVRNKYSHSYTTTKWRERKSDFILVPKCKWRLAQLSFLSTSYNLANQIGKSNVKNKVWAMLRGKPIDIPVGNAYFCCLLCPLSAWKYSVFETAAESQRGTRRLKWQQIGTAKTNNICSIIFSQ